MNRILPLLLAFSLLALLHLPVLAQEAAPAQPAGPFTDALVKFKAWAVDYQEAGRWPEAVWAWEVAAGLDPSNPEVVQGLTEARQTTSSLAEGHTTSGQRALEAGNAKEARKEFLLALYYDPEQTQALDYLKLGVHPGVFDEHTVKAGETLDDVARTYSNEPGLGRVVAYYNDLSPNTALQPGTMLRVPKLDGLVKRKPEPVQPKAQEAAEVQEAPAPASPEETADKAAEYAAATLEEEEQLLVYDPSDDLTEGRNLLKQGRYTETAALSSSILEQAPGNSQALELANAAHYTLGKKAKDNNELETAFDELNKVETGYKDTAYLLAEVRRILASQHYNEGIRCFTQDELEAALKEWRLTLYYDPGHPTVRQDIAKAEEVRSRISALK